MSLLIAGSSALEEQVALARITRKRCRALEIGTGIFEASELSEEVAAHGRQQVVGLERRLRDKRVDELQAGFGTKGHGDRDGSIQLYHR